MAGPKGSRGRVSSTSSTTNNTSSDKPDKSTKPKALVLDLGGVVFNFNGAKDAPIDPFVFKHIMDSPHWHDFERGKITEEALYELCTSRYNLQDGALAETVRLAALSLKTNDEFVDAVKAIKKASNGELKVIAMSNMAHENYEVLQKNLEDTGIFDEVYLSADVGIRKPDVAFYEHVFQKAGIDPNTTVFVDDTCQNVILGQTLGMTGITFTDNKIVIQKLQNIYGDPVQRGQDFMQKNAKNLWCHSSTTPSIEVKDQFQQILMYHLTGDASLVNIVKHDQYTSRFNVFAYGAPVLTSETYPDDIDTTTLGMLYLNIDEKVIHQTLDDMLEFLNPDGLALCYFDHVRPRLDPFISANALRLFYKHGRGHQMARALTFMENLLRTRAYEHGTRYYHLADWVFYYLSSLCQQNPTDTSLNTIRTLLVKRLTEERMGATQDSPSAALRLLASQALGLVNVRDTRILLESQRSDGSWGGWVYRFGRSGIFFGSDGLVTALATKALKQAKENGEANDDLA